MLSSFLWYAEGSPHFYLTFPSDDVFIDATDAPQYLAVHLHKNIGKLIFSAVSCLFKHFAWFITS